MKIHVVARSVSHGEAFLDQHTSLSDSLVIEVGQRSYFDLLNRLISNSLSDYVCVIHDDVVLPDSFTRRLEGLVSEFSDRHIAWALAGNAGVTSFKIGFGATDITRYICDPHGGANLQGCVLPAQTVDGNVMLLNTKALRDAGVRLPSFDGFQFYDIAMSVEAQCAHLGVFVAPQLACYHASGGSQALFESAKASPSLNAYLQSRLINRHFVSLNGLISLPLNLHQQAGACDIEMASLINGISGSVLRVVAIVVRTQFTRRHLLQRTLDSIEAFICAAGNATKFHCYIVSDQSIPSDFVTTTSEKLIKVDVTDSVDTRYRLVEAAARSIDADFFWFIDDDDWLFPNEAPRLAAIINATPRNSLFLLDSQHYIEDGSDSEVPIFYSKPGRYFYARDFSFSLGGSNHTPFCGAIFSANTLREIDAEVYESVTYYEDFMTVLSALLVSHSVPIVIDKLFVGISLRSTGNTVTETNRTKWNKSMSELVSHLVNTKTASAMLSLATTLNRHTRSSSQDASVSQVNNLNHQLNSILASRSWRITRPIRVIGRLLRRDISLPDVLRALKDKRTKFGKRGP